ncbi:virulence factor TspB C-terminal domain-related protein [Acinetobacter junii]|uniref:virulence factor TspB C-terminal domain-related protein n=1 Tax=Acinetobacter junii TaxID=40215 RepID=UPI00244B0E88|nr:virulence factor TspB C-terminal domain-related protein [Acinetobacter junii]MDH1915129.1 virulence factor TspB C-terminal domain-related protein [Acinetobacter junii]
MGRITSFSKQVIVFFLVTALMIRPTFAAVGGWDLKNPVAQGASTVYDATKNVVINGKKFIKESSVKITPTATSVAKVLARGGAGYALSVAVEQLLGSVDWVLDPANNRIKYKIQVGSLTCTHNWFGNQTFDSPEATCSAIGNATKGMLSLEKVGDGYRCHYKNNAGSPQYTEFTCAVVLEEEEKYLPLDVVAAQVISNAESDTDRRAAAQVATTAAAADIVAEAENDNVKARPIASQAEANATTKPADAAEAEKANEAQGQAKPNTANPDATDLSLTFPIFCNWAPTICEAAQTVISFPTTLTDWWNTGKSKAEEWATSISEAWTKVKEEYADKPQQNTDTELDIPDLEQDIEVDTDISFGGSCPAPLSSDINFMGLNKTIEFSFDPVCQIAEFIKPVVISISAFSAALIVAGIRTEDD